MKMFTIKLQDKVPCSEISKRTKLADVKEYILKQKWKWTGHITKTKCKR